MAGIRDIALTYYGKFTHEQKKKAKELFRSMDGNGDGKIEIGELLDSFQIKGPWRSWYYRQFEDPGNDRKDSLDIEEFITFSYLEKFTDKILCDGCQVILNGKIYFTCVHCFDERDSSFDLCRSCYSKNNFTHSHRNGPAPVFRDTSSLLLLKRKEVKRKEVDTSMAIIPVPKRAIEDVPRASTVDKAKAIIAVANRALTTTNALVAFVSTIAASVGCTIM